MAGALFRRYPLYARPVTEPDAAPAAELPALKALDPPMVPFALIGMAVWAVVGVIMLIAGAPDSWLWTCLAGFLLGIPGLLTMLRHDANRRRRRAAATT